MAESLSEKLGLTPAVDLLYDRSGLGASGIEGVRRRTVEAVAAWLANREYLSPAAREIRERLLGDEI